MGPPLDVQFRKGQGMAGGLVGPLVSGGRPALDLNSEPFGWGVGGANGGPNMLFRENEREEKKEGQQTNATEKGAGERRRWWKLGRGCGAVPTAALSQHMQLDPCPPHPVHCYSTSGLGPKMTTWLNSATKKFLAGKPARQAGGGVLPRLQGGGLCFKNDNYWRALSRDDGQRRSVAPGQDIDSHSANEGGEVGERERGGG